MLSPDLLSVPPPPQSLLKLIITGIEGGWVLRLTETVD